MSYHMTEKKTEIQNQWLITWLKIKTNKLDMSVKISNLILQPDLLRANKFSYRTTD